MWAAKNSLILTLALAASAMSSGAVAQPSGGSVVFGGATIALPSPETTRITQTTNTAIINWQNFSLASGASVIFDQPGSAAIALNRVLGGGSSFIDGNLLANGQVWIINANGVLFGRNSQVNVAGLLATTSDIADSDFAAGRYDFSRPSSNPSASVDNEGTIRISGGGSAVLSGPHVSNSGLIEATAGQIVLSGANAFTVDFDGDNLLRYAITAPVANTPTDANGAPRTELVTNSGTLSAAGGRILLTARAAANIANNVVNNSGMISATSASIHNGEVVLDAGEGTVEASGAIDATGNGAGQTGGRVTLAGGTVRVADNTKIDASGDQGGGTISIGGGLHGSGAYPAAHSTSVGSAAIHADANTSGNGGTVAIWSSGHTDFGATVTAHGGALSGNGGMVETSGATLNVAPNAAVATSAPHGASGTWLLDPDYLEIVLSDSGDPPLTGGVLPYSSPQSQIMASTITNALSSGGGTDVTLQAINDITVNANVGGGGTTHTLTLDAGRSIILNATLELGSQGSLVLSAKNPDATGVAPGSATISGTGAINAKSVSFILASDGSGGDGIGSADAFIRVVAGTVTVTTNGASAYIQGTNSAKGLVLGSSNVGAGSLFAKSPGNLTLLAGATLVSSASGDAIVLSATQNFINNSDSGAISLTGGGRFLIYSAAPGSDVFGGLNSNNSAIWNTTYPTGVTPTGSRYVFASPATLTFTSTDLAKTYGDDANAALATAFTVSGYQAGVAGAYLGDTAATAFSGAPTLTSAGAATGASVAGGPYAITIGQGSLASPSGYAFNFSSAGRLSVGTAQLTIVADPQNKTYGAADPSLTFVASGFVNNESAAILSGTLARAAGENVGSYAINQGTLSAGTNYTIAYTANNLDITPASLTVVADHQSKVYGAGDPALTFVVTGFQFADNANSVLSGALARAAGENVGSYAINQGSLAANSNYTIAFTANNLDITPAQLTVVADHQTKVYGASDPALTFVVTGFQFADNANSVLSGALARAAGENVGNYAINQGGLAANGNYTIAFTGDNLAITPASLSVAADTLSKVYGSADPTLTYLASGFVNGDTSAVFSGALTRAPGESVAGGPYAISQGSLSAGPNYGIVFTGANFSITPATLTYTANTAARTYGAANPVFGGNVTGFVAGDTQATATNGNLLFTSAATATSNVGSYAITGSGLSANNGNYVFVQAPGNATALTINPATLTYVADPFSREFGDPNPAFTGAVTGFANGENLANATTGALTFATAATSASAPGSYAINGSGLSANHGNYVFVQSPSNATALTVTASQDQGPPPLFLPWLFGRGGDRPTDQGSLLLAFANSDGSGANLIVVSGSGGQNLPNSDGAAASGPIAELTTVGNGYLEPLTSADRLSGSLSHYFENGSLFDGDYASWGNEALWY